MQPARQLAAKRSYEDKRYAFPCMKIKVFDMPKGMPLRIGQIGWMEVGEQVQANMKRLMGERIPARQTMRILDSGIGREVSGSGLWREISLLLRGSMQTAIITPNPRPIKHQCGSHINYRKTNYLGTAVQLYQQPTPGFLERQLDML